MEPIRMVNFFTIVAKNYLGYAYTLGKSIKQFHPEAEFSIFLVDDIEKEYKYEVEKKGFCTIYPDNIKIDDYAKFTFKYNVTEACTGVKPYVFEYLLSHGASKIIYLDPDILCFRYLNEVIDSLDNHEIVITPHSTSPVKDNSFPNDTVHLTTGAYNLGFIALRSSIVSREFIDWWCEKLFNSCNNAPELGIFVDQKWIDLVPAYFPNVLILKDKSHNIAYWNLHEREIRKMENGDWFVLPCNKPIAFFHFSGVSINKTEQITKYQPKSPFNKRSGVVIDRFEKNPELNDVYKIYIDKLNENDTSNYLSLKYAYNYYDNGEKISDIERAIYFSSPTWQSVDKSPFCNEEGSFLFACRKNGIKSTQSEQIKSHDSIEIESKKYRFFSKVIHLLIQKLIFLVGSERYTNLAKYIREQFVLINHNFLLK
jgi:Nucleotide-diphospho-sugar transferase